MVDEGDRIVERTRFRLAEAKRADMQFVDDQVLDARRQRPIRYEFICPEGFGTDLLTRPKHDLRRVANNRAALRSIERLGRSCICCTVRIEIAGPNLHERPEIGAVGGRTIIFGDTEHVGRADHRPEIRQRRIVRRAGAPDTAAAAPHADGLHCASAVVRDITDRRVRQNEGYAARVRRPDSEANAISAVRRRSPIRAEAAAPRQEIRLFRGPLLEHKAAFTSRRVFVVDLGRNRPAVQSGGPIEEDAPAKIRPNLSAVE